MDDSPIERYKFHFYEACQGFPLWIPEPLGHSPSCREAGVRIGDVGYVTPGGGFVTVFNVCAPADHPMHILGVPDEFEQIHLENFSVTRLSGAHVLTSPYLNGGSARTLLRKSTLPSFEKIWSPTKFYRQPPNGSGAVLYLPLGASQISCSGADQSRLRQYAQKHAMNWFKFSLAHHDLPQYSLHLVTTVTKTSDWLLGLYDYANAPHGAAVFELCSSDIPGGSLSFSWGTSVTFSSRSNLLTTPMMTGRQRVGSQPTPDDILFVDTPGKQNQCPFFTSFTVSLSEVGCQQLSPSLYPVAGNSDDEGSEQLIVERVTRAPQLFQPATDSNRFPPNNFRDTYFSIYHDDDWMGSVRDNGVPHRGMHKSSPKYAEPPLPRFLLVKGDDFKEIYGENVGGQRNIIEINTNKQDSWLSEIQAAQDNLTQATPASSKTQVQRDAQRVYYAAEEYANKLEALQTEVATLLKQRRAALFRKK